MGTRGVAVLLAALAGVVAAAVATAGGAHRSAGPLRVVAAESSWGSIAAQLGGNRVQVTSLISNPAADPHDYEPTAVDARAVAGAQLVIENGAGYDPWIEQLVAANPVDGRIALDAGKLVGVEPGANPHLWYSPVDVRRVIAAIVADYRRLDAKDAAYFERRRRWYESTGLARYNELLAVIKDRYRGVAVGASESIFAPLAQVLSLDLVTPASFLKAISEGTEPTAADRQTIDRQLARRNVKVWIYNSQNSTPDVARITDAARKRGIPVATITETLSPEGATFQSWQIGELEALAAALHRATGR